MRFRGLFDAPLMRHIIDPVKDFQETFFIVAMHATIRPTVGRTLGDREGWGVATFVHRRSEANMSA